MSETKVFGELVTKNVFEMTSHKLKDHIDELRRTKHSFLSTVAPSVNLVNQQLELAQHELSSRTATMLAKVSTGISTFAVVVAATSLALWRLKNQPSLA